MFIRIVTGIRDHFESRIVEWVMGAAILNYGLGLVSPGTAWTNPDPWRVLAYYAPENAWGWLCVLLGLLRLIALVVNGTFADTAYSRFSPHVRGVTALGALGFWMMVLLSVSASGSIGSRIYILPLVLEVWCIFHAWRDTGRAKAARDGMAR